MNHRTFKIFFALMLAALVSTGCANLGKSLKSFITGKDPGDSTQARVAGMTKFSDNENMRPSLGERQYRRMNRQKFEEEADLKADAGSLWVMEGQGAYLFAQNQIRIVGDLLNVKIEGSPKSQLQTKVRVISRLLDRLDGGSRGLASQGATPATPQAAATPAPQGAAQGQKTTDGEGGDGAQAQAANKSETPFAVQVVPTRIVEQLRDGSYRVRGMQPFMIGKREYRVIVTGIIRPEDFDDAGVDAGKLLDPQFDIVSSRKGATL